MSAKRSGRTLTNLFRQVIGYGFGIIGRQLIVYLSLPLFTNGLSQETFGVIAITTSLVAFAQMVIGAGLNSTTIRLYNDSDSPSEQSFVIGASHLYYIGYTLAVAVLIAAFAPQIATTLLGDEALRNVVYIIAFDVFFIGPYSFYRVILRIQFRPVASSVHDIVQSLLQIGFALIFVYPLGLGVLGYWIGFTIGSSLGLLIIAWLVRDVLTFKTTGERLREVFSYSLPLIPAELSNWALRLADRFLIAIYLGVAAAAVYEIAYRVGGLVELVLAPVNNAYPPFALSKINDEDATEVYRDALTLVTFFAVGIVLMIVAFSTELVLLLSTPIYLLAVIVIPWIAFARTMWAAKRMIEIALHISKRPSYIGALTAAAAVYNIALNLVLLPSLGILGAGIATFVAFAWLLAGLILLSQLDYPYPVDWGRMLRIGILVLIVLVGLSMVDDLGLAGLSDFAARLALLLAYGVAGGLLGIVPIHFVLAIFKRVNPARFPGGR